MYLTSSFEAIRESKWISTILQNQSPKVSHFANLGTSREKNQLNAYLVLAGLGSNQSLINGHENSEKS